MIENVAIPEERIELLRKDKELMEKLRKFVDVKVKIDDCVVIESDDPLCLLRVKEVIKAFGRGFDVDTSLNLLDEDYFLDVLDIKEFTGKSRNRQTVLKGRVIGSKGKTKNIIEKHTEVKIVIYGKTVSIVGKAKNVCVAREAIEMLLNGANHNTVYRFLESQRAVL
jgi:ribosomal RNA assembly protein